MKNKQGIITFGSVFGLLSLGFLPPLIVLTVRINEKFQLYNDMLQNAEDTKANMYRCLQDASCTQYGKLFHSSGTSDINNKAERRVIDENDNDQITKIVLKNIRRGSDFDIKVKKEFGRQVFAGIKEFSKHLTSPRLIYAHLTAKGQPTKTASGYTMESWEWQPGARFAFTSPSMYNKNKSMQLNVAVGGVYNVYLHTTFVSSKTKPEKCQLSHQVKRKTGDLMKSSEMVANCGSTSRSMSRSLRSKPLGFHTLDTMGVYRLAQNETLTVSYEMPDHVTIGDADTQTYFGIFRV